MQYGNVQQQQQQHQSYGPPPSMMDDEPASKRQKTTEEQLVPEEEWLAMYSSKGPVTICIQCPHAQDKAEWTLNGQTMNVPFDLTDSVKLCLFVFFKLNE